MASAPAKVEDISETLKQLTLYGVKRDGRELGSGAYGKVYTVKYSGVVYAAKEIHALLQAAGAEEVQTLRNNFIRECYHCNKLDHVNVVPLVGIYYPNKQALPVMVMELMDTNLTAYVTQPDVSLERKLSILHDVAEGLSYLHTCSIIHRDLSPNNVLIKHSGVDQVPPVAKIADLGVAKMVQADSRRTKAQLTKLPGTIDYMPPEAFEDNPHYDTSLDVFSYGGVMLYTVNGKWPRPTAQVKQDPITNELKALSEVERRQQYLDEVTGPAEVLKPLIKDCLNNDYSLRPSIFDLSNKIKPMKESPPLVPALQSGCYEMTWEKCADLPSPMLHASAVPHNEKVYVMAGIAPDKDTYRYVFSYDIPSNHWDTLPPPGHIRGVLQIIDGKLSVIGGIENITATKATSKVSTLINNRWIQHYPNMTKGRVRHGVATHSDYVIVAGGIRDINTLYDDIELLYYKHPAHWITTNINLLEPMYNISLTISDDLLYITGYKTSDHKSSNKAYQVAVDKITSSVAHPPTSSQTFQWTTIPSTPHYHTAIIPNSSPPVIIGGDLQNVPIPDVAMLKQASWSKVASLSSARTIVSVVAIDCHSILVIGGTTGSKTSEEAKAHALTTVEKGTVKQSHIAAIPTQDTQCIIQ